MAFSELLVQPALNALTITRDQAFPDTLAHIVAHRVSDFLDMNQVGEAMNEFGIGVFRHRIQAERIDEGLPRLQIFEFQGELKAEQARREVAETTIHDALRI
ncbi:unnamed protein product [Clonostachys rosea]|uniref:Uncharacterized protein n=1 Tax=Bionectria ochroleuca TaxID=29856 RepID=A0ABY6UNS3_BIOOC|nr:unnamed protein product [Clonostachys rosea]